MGLWNANASARFAKSPVFGKGAIMSEWKSKLGSRLKAMAFLGTFAFVTQAVAKDLIPIEVPGDQAYPESMSATADGTIYISSIASGGVARVKPGEQKAELWIKPGAFDTRNTFGVLVDEPSKTLWVCSNDISSLGVPGPSTVPGAYLKGFDLATGEGKFSAQFPSKATICNDMVIAPDGTMYVTNTAAPQILRLRPGAKELEIWLENDLLAPKNGAGLDGIALGGDGNLYVNTYGGNELFRVEVKDGKPGAVTKLETSRALKNPDALRQLNDNTFLMAEGGGTLDRVTVNGDKVTIETLKDGLDGPTSLAKIGGTVWVGEGQLSHLFNAKQSGPPKLPFQIVPVTVGN
jgi:streptogramin lyase